MLKEIWRDLIYAGRSLAKARTFTFVCVVSLGIGMAAMLQLAAATPVFSHCHQCAYHHLRDDLLSEPLEIVDGMIAVPQGPGLGVDVDRAKLERYQIG